MRFFFLWLRHILKRHIVTACLLGLALAGGAALAVFVYGSAPATGGAQASVFSLQAVPTVSASASAFTPPTAAASHSSPASSRSSSASAAYTPPATVALQRLSVQQPQTIDGVLRSSARMAADTVLSYPVAQIDVSVGDFVTAGQRLCQLDTTELDGDIAAARQAVARAQADDALKLEQAQKKLADAKARLAADETRLAALVQSALLSLEAARHQEAVTIADQWTEGEAQEAARLAEIARETLDAYEGTRTQIEQKYQNAEANNIEISQEERDADQQLLDSLWDAAGIAQVNWDEAAAAHRAVWESKYAETYAQARPSPAQQNYEKALNDQATTLQENQADIAEAESDVEAQQLAGSAAAKQADLDKLLLRLAQAAVYAPIGGTVTEVNAQVGLLPGATRDGSSLFVVQDTARLVAEVLVPGDAIVQYSLGLAATVTVPALAGQSWQATIAAISPAANRSGIFTLTLSFAAPPQGLRAGTQAQVHFSGSQSREVLASPESAVMLNARGQNVVYLYTAPTGAGQHGSVREVSVQTAPAGEGMLEITANTLKEGDLLVANAAQYAAFQSSVTLS